MILPSRIYIALDELSSRHRKAITGLVKELGFVPEEISELVVKVEGRKMDEG